MRVAVLGTPTSWYVNDLQRAAGPRDQVVPVAFNAIGATVGSLNQTDAPPFFSGSIDLRDFDCLLVRTMPPGSLEQVVLRMDILGQWEKTGRFVINPPRSLEIAVDKYLALTRLEEAGLTVPRTVVCQTVEEAMRAFARLGGDVVIKPLFGSEGRGMTRVSDEDSALRAFKMLVQINAVIYLQEFVEHEGYDYRLLVIGERIISMRRRHATDWRTNVSRGAVPEAFEADASLNELARRAAAAVGTPLAGVDILPARNGTLYALEVNAVPGWRGLARTSQVDVASLVIEFLRRLVHGQAN